MSKITIMCSAREYYSGQDTYELPFDINETHIDNVQPDGYGEALIFLNAEGDKIIKAQNLDFEEDSYWKHVAMATHHDWLILEFGNQYGLKWRGEMFMEFCEVDENMIDHWEVDDGED